MKKLLAIGLTSLMLTGCATATQPSKTETATSKTAEAETRNDTSSQELGRFRRLSQKSAIFNNVVFQGVKKQRFLTPSSFNKHKILPTPHRQGSFFCVSIVPQAINPLCESSASNAHHLRHKKKPRAENPG